MNTDPKQDESRQSMNLLVGHGPDAMKIVKALGLPEPELTRCFTFSMAAHEAAIVTVELEKYVKGDTDTVDALASVFERYHLVKIEDETGDEGQGEESP